MNERHDFKVSHPHRRGGFVASCRCGVELLVAKPGAPRKYRRTPIEPWSSRAPVHVERPEPEEVVVGSWPGNYPTH